MILMIGLRNVNVRQVGTFNDAKRAKYVTLVNNFRYGLVQYTEEPIHVVIRFLG